MRRKDKAILDPATIEEIIGKSLVCRLAMAEDNQPYVVPLSFGFKDNTLYFHSSPEGKKIDMLKKNSMVCFEFDLDHEVFADEEACQWGMKYRSVIGFGKALLVEDLEEKRKGLDVIMQHYSGRSFQYPEFAVENVVVIKIEIESMTGKISGY